MDIRETGIDLDDYIQLPNGTIVQAEDVLMDIQQRRVDETLEVLDAREESERDADDAEADRDQRQLAARQIEL